MASEPARSILNELLEILEIVSAECLSPAGGLFGAHPLRRLIKADRLSSHNEAFLSPLLESVKECRNAPGFGRVRQLLLSAGEFWSARYQLALGTRLKRLGHNIEFEKAVDRKGQFIADRSDYSRLGDQKEIAAAVDIHLVDYPLDIEVFSRAGQFFRTFDNEFFRRNRCPSWSEVHGQDITCSVSTSKLLSLDKSGLDTIDEYFSRSIPEIFEGRDVSPLVLTDSGLSVEFSLGAPCHKEWDYQDQLGLESLDGMEVGGRLYLCYEDKTPVSRLFDDLSRGLRDKRKTRRAYPKGRKQVMALEFPLTLYRFWREDKESLCRKLQHRLKNWRKQNKKEKDFRVVGFLLSEHIQRGSFDAPLPELFNLAIELDVDSEPFREVIAPLAQPCNTG